MKRPLITTNLNGLKYEQQLKNSWTNRKRALTALLRGQKSHLPVTEFNLFWMSQITCENVEEEEEEVVDMDARRPHSHLLRMQNSNWVNLQIGWLDSSEKPSVWPVGNINQPNVFIPTSQLNALLTVNQPTHRATHTHTHTHVYINIFYTPIWDNGLRRRAMASSRRTPPNINRSPRRIHW